MWLGLAALGLATLLVPHPASAQSANSFNSGGLRPPLQLTPVSAQDTGSSDSAPPGYKIVHKPAKPAKPPAASPQPEPAALHADAARGLNDPSTPSQKIQDALTQIHMTDCAPAVQRITDFLFEGQDANFIAQPLGPDTIRWPTVFSMEVADPSGGHSHFAILVISGNCSGMYEETRYWPQPCSIVKSLVFSKYVGDQLLQSQVRVSSDGPARQVFLTPAGQGCLSVKKELFH